MSDHLMDRLTGWALVLTLVVTPAWATPRADTTLRAMESSENAATTHRLKAGLEAVRQTGLEEAYEMVGSTAVFHRPFRLEGAAVRLPAVNNSLLDATGGLIAIAAGARIGANTTLKLDDRGGRIDIGAAELFHTVVEQNVVIRDGVKARNSAIQGAPGAGRVVVGEGTELTDAHVYPGVILLPRSDPEIGSKLVPTVVKGATVEGRNVVWGSAIGLSAYVRPNNILIGASIDDGSSLTRAHLDGTAFAHKVTGARGVFIRLQPSADLTPFSPAFYQWLERHQAAGRFGVTVNYAVVPLVQPGPRIYPHVVRQVQYRDQQFTLKERDHNGGHRAHISDFFSTGDGWKSYAVVMGGVMLGIGAGVKVPAYVGPDTVIQSEAEATLLEAAAPGSLVLPLAVSDPAKKVRPGFFEGDRLAKLGKSGSAIVETHLGAIETLATLASVSAEGYQSAMTDAADDDTGLALRTEVAILDGNAREGLGYTSKLKEMAGLPGNAYADRETRILQRLDKALAVVGLKAGMEESLEQVLEAFRGRMRGWHGHATRPIILLSDRTAMFGINSGRYDETETARRLRTAQVSPGILRQLLEALETQLRLPSTDRVVGARAAAIDLAVAAQRMDKMALSPAEALRSARVRVQGTDGWRGHRTPNERMFTLLGSGRLSPELVEFYHFSFVEWAIAQGLMQPGDRYVLGYDPRDDAEIAGIPPGSYTKAAIRGAQRAGAAVVDVGVVPIWAAPLYMVWSGAKACGVITASHNPKDDTGNKLFVGPALKLFPEDDYEVSGHFFRNLGAQGWKPEKNDLPAYQSVKADEDAHDEAIALAEQTALQPDNSWAQADRPLSDWLVVVDAARGAYAGYAADPEHPRPDDPSEFGIMSRAVAGLGATVWEVGKNLRRGNVNEGSGVGQFEGAGLLEVHRQDLDAINLLQNHEMFRQMFTVADAHRDALRAGTTRLAGIMSDADGDRLYLLIYDPATDTILILSGDETAFIQATFLLQAAPPAWREAFKGAGFATTVESDFFAADAAAALGLKKEYTGVGDKWILLQAVTALLRASIGYLEREGSSAIQQRLAQIKTEVDALGGASMRMAAAVRLMERLDALADEAHVALDQFLTTPGAVASAIASEESGHNVTALYLTTKDGRRLPVFIGNGQKSAINTLVGMQALFPDRAARRDTIYGKSVDLIGFVREPFQHGHKRTHYAFYVDKTRLVPGTAAWQGLSRVIREGVPRTFGVGYTVQERPRTDEPDMLYCVVQNSAGRDVGAIFARPSGTENKASLYVRGLRELEEPFNRLGAMLEVAANQVLGDTSSPSYQAREAIATRLRAAEGAPIPLDALRRDMETHVRPNLGPQDFGAWWALFWKEMTEKAKVFTEQDGHAVLVPRVLQRGDRGWVYNTAAAGAEEAGESEAPARLVGEIRGFVAATAVPPGLQPGMWLVVDLATGYDPDALAAFLLPRGSVVVVGTEALRSAERLAGSKVIERGITTVTIDQTDAVGSALRAAVSEARGGSRWTVRVYSGLGAEELQSILHDVSEGSVDFYGGLTTEEILQRLRSSDEATAASLRLFGRAKSEWNTLREYL